VQIARKRPLPAQSTPKQPEPTCGEAVELGPRNARARIRKLENTLRAEQAKTALLSTQLKHLREENNSLKTTKKRKKIKIDSNEKLASFKNILSTQKAQDLKAKEKAKRAARRAKKAKK